MRTLFRSSASVLLEPIVTHSEFRYDTERGELLNGSEEGGFPALTWLTVGLGMLVTGLAVALTVLAIVQ